MSCRIRDYVWCNFCDMSRSVEQTVSVLLRCTRAGGLEVMVPVNLQVPVNIHEPVPSKLRLHCPSIPRNQYTIHSAALSSQIEIPDS